MTESTNDLDEIIAAEYFRQYENIVRGASKRKCIERFTSTWKTSSRAPGAHLSQLVQALNEADVQMDATRLSLRDQLRALRVRPLIYCFISSLVCVLLLHYA